MLKKIVAGILILSVLGAVVAVFAYQTLSKDDQITSADSIPVLEQQTTGITQESQQEEIQLEQTILHFLKRENPF